MSHLYLIFLNNLDFCLNFFLINLGFCPKDDDMDTDKDDVNDANCISDNLCRRQLLSDAELDLQGIGGTKLITDESQASACGQVRFNYIPTF